VICLVYPPLVWLPVVYLPIMYLPVLVSAPCCRELFDTEMEAAAYDTAVWRLKPRDAMNHANFKDSCPDDVAEVLKSLDKVGAAVDMALALAAAAGSCLHWACLVSQGTSAYAMSVLKADDTQ